MRKLATLALVCMLGHPATRPALLATFPLLINTFICVINSFHCCQGVFAEADSYLRPASPPHDLHTYQPEYARTKEVRCDV